MRTVAVVGRILYAKKAPARKSGKPTPTKLSAYRFSFLCRPGARKAHSWYSQTGVDSTTPAMRETFSASVNGVSRPSMTRCAQWVSDLTEVDWLAMSLSDALQPIDVSTG